MALPTTNIKGVNYSNNNKIKSECAMRRTHYCSVMSKHWVRLYYSLYISTICSIDVAMAGMGGDSERR